MHVTLLLTPLEKFLLLVFAATFFLVFLRMCIFSRRRTTLKRAIDNAVLPTKKGKPRRRGK